MIDPNEDCDGTNFGTKSCTDFNFGGGMLQCNSCCHLIVSGCTPLENCTNGFDDNGDGLVDCQDPECVGKMPCIDSCRPDLPLSSVPGDGLGDTTGRPHAHQASCSSATPGETSRSSSVVAPATGTLSLDMENFSSANFSVSVRTDCETDGSEIGCTNTPNPNAFGDITLGVPVTMGQTYYLMVQGMTPADFGEFDLTVDMTLPESICDDLVDNDFNGYTDCDDPSCQVTPACVPGTTPTGSTCTVNTDCTANANDPVCLNNLEFPGGYCSEFCNLTADDCSPGNVCYGGLMLSKDGVCLHGCTADTDCNTAAGYSCGDLGLSTKVCVLAETACNDYVDNNFNNLIDCQDPVDCQQLPACVPGASAIGQPCTLNTQCFANINNPLCLDEANNGYPGGYCSHWCDPTVPTDCGANGVCVPQGPNGGNVCMTACITNAQCRPGYSCQDFGFPKDICTF